MEVFIDVCPSNESAGTSYILYEEKMIFQQAAKIQYVLNAHLLIMYCHCWPTVAIITDVAV